MDVGIQKKHLISANLSSKIVASRPSNKDDHMASNQENFEVLFDPNE